ncbi:MAG: hypothetical protein ACI8RC_001829, partial [Ilumatobacter sp.]
MSMTATFGTIIDMPANQPPALVIATRGSRFGLPGSCS